MGGVSRHTYAATFPPDQFFCLLDELPLHLIPHSAFASELRHERKDLIFNPDCIVCPAEDLPDELQSCRDLVSGFALQGTMVWVRDRLSDSLLPFWLGPRLEAVLQRVRASESFSTLPERACSVLSRAGILIAPDDQDLNTHRWQQSIKNAAGTFQKAGYAPLSGLIHPFHVAALRRYYRHLIRMGRIKLGDGQSSRRYVAYNEPVAKFFHRQIAKTLSAVAGEPLKPSYVYMASYLSGAELKRHTDREQCEFSVTLCLDYSPEPALETPWPIKLDTSCATISVHQALGDGLAYRGTKLPHHRDRLGAGQTSTSIFFHYVSADFQGSLD